MKKILVSFLAIAALIGCSKADITYDDQPQEIGFTPYSKKNVKSAVTTTDYPNTLNMYVFAQAGAAGATDVTTYDEPYFINAEFNDKSVNPSAEVDESNGIFSGTAQPYYWPNVKELIFSGISKSGNVNAATNGAIPSYAYFTAPAESSAKSEWQITLNGYAPGTGTTIVGNNDLMWFPTTNNYAKTDIIGTGKPGHVDVVMKHACSWITINIKGDATTGDANTSWKITDLTLKDVAQSATVILGSEASWSNLATGAPLNVFKDDAGKALTYSDEANFVGEDYTNIDIKDLILVPQATKTLTLTYKYVSQKGAASDGSEDIVITEVKDIPLAYQNDQGWKPGVHYIYNITIGTSEILIEPTVDEWDPEIITGIEVN